MSDEMKKPEETTDVPLPESELEKVAGGVHNVDKASPVLMKVCASGEHFTSK
jgi:type VI protein secretion system component Hcp